VGEPLLGNRTKRFPERTGQLGSSQSQGIVQGGDRWYDPQPEPSTPCRQSA